MRRRLALSSLVCGLTFLLAGTASATPITWTFSGTITGVDDLEHRLDGSVVLGTPFRGSYTFESTMADDLPNDPTVGMYTHPAPATSIMVLDVGSYHIVGKSSGIRVENSTKDLLGMGSDELVEDPIGLGLGYMGAGCRDISGAVFSSDSLPLVPSIP